VGANSGNPRCSLVQGGTLLDMSGMNELVEIRHRSVTVQAGLRLRDLVRTLAEHGLELTASFEDPDRSVGGLIASGFLACDGAEDDGGAAECLLSLRVVTPTGKRHYFDLRRPEILAKLRGSLGLVGVIYEVSLRVRRIRPYKVRSRRMTIGGLAGLVAQIAAAPGGIKIFVLPFRDRAYVEMREPAAPKSESRDRFWRVRDWLCNKFLPDCVHLLGRFIPVRGLRDPLIDGFGEATQLLTNTRLTDAASNAMEQTGKFRRIGPASRTQQCCWYFPAERFGELLYAYRDFCQRYYAQYRYRCDLPAVAYRMPRHTQSLLSPSYHGPAFALNLRSTNTRGWDDFLMDFAYVAERFGGVPVFNQTRCFTRAQADKAYGERLQKFRAMRRRVDPENRMLNQFFAEFMN
jgi:FAD/FMN-containing dehydrogenase